MEIGESILIWFTFTTCLRVIVIFRLQAWAKGHFNFLLIKCNHVLQNVSAFEASQLVNYKHVFRQA